MTSEVFGTNIAARRNSPLRTRHSRSTITEAASHTATYSSLAYDEEIDDALELREAMQRYSGVSSQEFIRLDDLLAGVEDSPVRRSTHP